MTRFARAKGSKSSNERVPEKATPWSLMKEEMKRKEKETQESKEREKHDKLRQENYDNFLKQQASEVKTEWADFPDNDTSKSKEKKNKKKTKKDSISKEEMNEMLKPDPEIDSQVEKLTAEIDKILEKEEGKSKKRTKSDSDNNIAKKIKVSEDIDMKSVKKSKKKEAEDVDTAVDIVKKKKKNKSKVITSVISTENEISKTVGDDAPLEVSAKTEAKTIAVPKPKKKKALKIKPVLLETPDKSEDLKQEEIIVDKDKSSEEMKSAENQPLTKSMKKRLMKKKKKEALKNEINANSYNKVSENKNNNQNTRKRKLLPEKNEKTNQFTYNQPKTKVAKIRDNQEHKRRKPEEGPIKMTFNGVEIEIVKFDGFPVKKEDADRLTELKKQMISKGIPRSEVRRTLQLERRKAEKSLTREKKKVCFQCRKSGHMLSECPEINSQQVNISGSGICFKCGSTEHTHFECKVTRGDDFKFASCFICREQGHIARQCPDNPKGLYPQGGACKLCGDVTHFKKDCPQGMKDKEDHSLSLNTISGSNLETLDESVNKIEVKPMPTKNKIIKF